MLPYLAKSDVTRTIYTTADFACQVPRHFSGNARDRVRLWAPVSSTVLAAELVLLALAHALKSPPRTSGPCSDNVGPGEGQIREGVLWTERAKNVAGLLQ